VHTQYKSNPNISLEKSALIHNLSLERVHDFQKMCIHNINQIQTEFISVSTSKARFVGEKGGIIWEKYADLVEEKE